MDSGDLPPRYVVVRLIGRGGMGRVFCARDTRLERNVALKVLRVTGMDQNGSEFDRAESVMRMMREARAVASLEHANIVTIYDVGELPTGNGEERFCFIAMELIEGRPLRYYVGGKDVTLETRVGWLADVARALAFAHERGIIHRDIKPDNVMIREDGVVKVLDFGLARRATGIVPQPGTPVLATLTEPGSVLGTVLYMAPEQMCGAVLDGRADQFSWGVIAYELLAGKPPWSGAADSIQVVAQILTHEPVPICALEPSVSPALGEVVHRAIARNKEDRFASMRWPDTTKVFGTRVRGGVGARQLAARNVGSSSPGSGGGRRWCVLGADAQQSACCKRGLRSGRRLRQGTRVQGWSVRSSELVSFERGVHEDEGRGCHLSRGYRRMRGARLRGLPRRRRAERPRE